MISKIKDHISLYYNIKVNIEFKKIKRKIKSNLSSYNSKKINNTIPSGNYFSLLLIDLLYKLFKLLFITEVKESTKPDYALPHRQEATLYVSNHQFYSDAYVISDLISKYKTSFSYISCFTESTLNKYPTKLLCKAVSVFVKRNGKMDHEDKSLLLNYIIEAKKQNISFYLCPEGGMSVSGNTKSMQYGILSYMLKAHYENMIIIKLQYNRLLDLDLYLKIRETGSWPRSKKSSLKNKIDKLRRTLTYSSSVYVETKKVSLISYTPDNVEALGNNIGYTLNSMYLFSDIEKITITVYASNKIQYDIFELYYLVRGLLDDDSFKSFKFNVSNICRFYNLKNNSDIIYLNENTHETLFLSVNQYIYAWLPYALKANNHLLSEDEMKCLYLNKEQYEQLMFVDLPPCFETIFKTFNIKGHLKEMIKSFDIK